MNALAELYQEVILDHHKSPRNFRVVEGALEAEGYNPLCGDRLKVYLTLEGDVIADVAFQGEGCAISRAAASMMTVSLKGKRRAEALALFASFHRMVTGQEHAPGDEERLGKLEVFAGVSQFPLRVKCASLPWHTLRAALAGEGKVSTE